MPYKYKVINLYIYALLEKSKKETNTYQLRPYHKSLPNLCGSIGVRNHRKNPYLRNRFNGPDSKYQRQ